MRGFEEDKRGFDFAPGFEKLLPGTSLVGQKTNEGEVVCRQAGDGQGAENSAGAGDGTDANASSGGGFDEAETGIGD